MDCTKAWKKPRFYLLSSATIKSGVASFGAERVLTCGGNVLTTVSLRGNLADSFCTDGFLNGQYDCDGIQSSPSGYYPVGPGDAPYSDISVARAPCS